MRVESTPVPEKTEDSFSVLHLGGFSQGGISLTSCRRAPEGSRLGVLEAGHILIRPGFVGIDLHPHLPLFCHGQSCIHASACRLASITNRLLLLFQTCLPSIARLQTVGPHCHHAVLDRPP